MLIRERSKVCSATVPGGELKAPDYEAGTLSIRVPLIWMDLTVTAGQMWRQHTLMLKFRWSMCLCHNEVVQDHICVSWKLMLTELCYFIYFIL